ncbi:NAD(P)-dependent alcohol dehydrogenase [Amycolatopsis sp. GM8]|uniref:NAD(P)-dependent alcohol dehydrogenase n=1 Tax=Amycolatopsis sp. GM8 TaxID=2896530 RepID=UPI001F2C09A6|nr:NAD(P)-dependent alcohol dehydrogenase [Amycolatopsis sp. GM8]
MRPTVGLAVHTAGGPVLPWSFERRDPRPHDVAVAITYCGVCYSDVEAVRGAREPNLPLVPGHEFVGRVSAVGDLVTSFRVGDSVAVGNCVDSCGACEECLAGQQNHCTDGGPTLTYLGVDRHDGRRTQGGWSTEYVADEAWVYRLPDGLDPAPAAPLLCAGITSWEALRHWEIGPGSTIGIVGIGGLGHLGVKFAKALGAEVVAFTLTPENVADIKALGADDVVVSSDPDALAAQARRFDFILDTASRAHDLSPYLRALRLHGTMCLLGIPPTVEVETRALRVGRHSLAGSGTGSPARVREMLDFCAEHGIVADVDVLPSTQLATALDRLERGDVKYRLVLDLADLTERAS